MKIIYIIFVLISYIFILSSQKSINFPDKIEATDDCKELSYLAIEKNVKITGRYYQDKNITWIVHSGSSLEFYAIGNSLNMLLIGDSSIYAEGDLRPRFGIYLDDKLFLDSTMNDLELKIELFKNEKMRKSKVKIMLLSENKYGGVGIRNINVYTCSNQKAINPTEKKNVTIEFIGDSMTCAYGVEGKDQNEHFKTTTENFSKSYAYLASQILKVDYSSVSYSGYGIVSGYSNGEKNPEDLVPLYYKKIGKNKNYQGNWDFKAHKYDIVFINLGANDYNYILADPEKRNDEFIQEYVNFLSIVKECNPNSLIICTVGNIGTNPIYKLIVQAVKLFGDEKVINYELPPQNTDDGFGSDWHPSEASQKRFSYIVAAKILELYEKFK